MQKLEKILEEIEQAKAEPWYRLNNYDTKRRIDGAIERLTEIIRKHMNDGWISVEERLPEEDGIYIVNDLRFNTPWVHTAGFMKKSNSWCENHGFYYDDKYGRYEKWRIIAWQPLPEPYRPERSEE